MLDAGQNIIARQLPKTGQITNYVAGDDGTYQAGWWRGRLNANNRTRFIQRTIGGDDIVLDRATGLMWPKDFAGAGAFNGNVLAWNFALAWTNGLNFAGFGDWRLPNALELASLINFETGPPYIWPPFINCIYLPEEAYWTSTTHSTVITQAMAVWFGLIVLAAWEKILQLYVIAVRKGV